MKKIWVWVLCFNLLSCNVDTPKHPDPQDVSEQKFVLEEDRESMSLRELNEQIMAAKVLLVVDLAYNRAFTIYDREVKDAFNVSTGERLSNINSGNLQTRTPTASSSIHLLDYCSKWYSGAGVARIPCHKKNRLGRGVVWFLGYDLGFHTRHESAEQDEDFFKFSSVEDRYRTRGCIAAHFTRLIAFFKLLFSDPAFLIDGEDEQGEKKKVLHPGVEQIQDAIKNHEKNEREGTHKNIAIRFEDVRGDSPSKETEAVVGPKVVIDARVVTINTKHTSWDLSKGFLDRHPMLNLLVSKEPHNPEAPYRMVTDCTADESVSLFRDSKSFESIGTLEKGAQLERLYRSKGYSGGPVQVDWVGLNNSGTQKVWIKSLDGFSCSEEYYSSSEDPRIQASK